MDNILDAGQPWIGLPVRALRTGNRHPVALPDSASILQDSLPINIPVLANDFDPEGMPITVVSATSVHGSVVIEADYTLTYTPAAGYVGTDTITYVIEDDQGQTQTGEVAITVSAPVLSIDLEPDNTFLVTAETGPIDITFTQPAEIAGTYQEDLANLSAGAINLVIPSVTGTPDVGQTLNAVPGLWIYDVNAGEPSRTWQWQRAGVDIPGATGEGYVFSAADVGQQISVVETLSDAFNQQSATSLAVGAGFSPGDDANLLGWWDSSDAATITATGSDVSSWTDKAGGPALTQAFQVQMPQTGVRTLNGLNVLDFDGGRLMESARTLPVTGDVAFHMVLEIDSVSNLYEAIFAVDAANDFQIDADSSTQFNGRLNTTGIGTWATLTGGPFSGPIIVSAVFDQTGTASGEVFVGGVSRGTISYTVPIDSAVDFLVMTNRSRNAWINGSVAEIVISGDVTNRATYHSYLSTKWGIT